MRNAPVLALSVTALSGTTPQNSAWFPANQLIAMSADCQLTGTLAGTLKMQVSDMPPSTQQASITGSDLTGASATIAAGSAGNIPFQNCAYEWVRLVFTPSAGTGNLTSYFKGSGI